jgi:hypothetical protein
MCCDAERKKWEKRQRAEAERIAKQDPRERLRELEDPTVRAVTMAMGDEAVAVLDAQIAEAKAACDAEYARQFPNGPQPIFTAKRASGPDMDLLKQVFGRAKLEAAFGDGGGGMPRIEAEAEKARLAQSLRRYAYAE